MHFPRFWTQRNNGDISCWGWSDTSADEAGNRASQRLEKLIQIIHSGSRPNQYGYGSNPLREEILKEFRKTDQAEPHAVVTRNAYGCLVLNTSNLMFVDIDLPDSELKTRGFFGGLFGKSKAADAPPGQKIIETISHWTGQNSGWGWRLYRTHSGFRLIATHSPVEPVGPDSDRIFAELGADPLYAKLCKNQKSYRARLTPKPWRCNSEKAPARWPWKDEKTRGRFEKWQIIYAHKAEGWSTCQFLQTLGKEPIHPELTELISFHDEATRALTSLPLA